MSDEDAPGGTVSSKTAYVIPASTYKRGGSTSASHPFFASYPESVSVGP